MIKNISFSVVLNAFSQIVLFAIFLFSAKIFGPEGRGAFSAIISLITLIGTVVGLSIGRVCAHEILSLKLTPESFFKKYFGTIGLIYVFTIVIGYLVFLFLELFYSKLFGKVELKFILILFVSLPYFIWNSYSVYLFSALDKILLQNKIGFFMKVLIFVLLLLMYAFNILSFTTFIIIYAIVNTLNLFLEHIMFYKEVKYELAVDFTYMSKIIFKCFQIHLDTIGYILYSSLTVVILNMNISLEELGYYNFALQLTSIIIIIPTIIAQYLNGLILNSSPDIFWPNHKRIMLYTMLICTVVMMISYFTIPILIDIAHLKFKPSLFIFNILLITILPNSFTILMGPQWLSRGHFKTISSITLICGVIGFIFLTMSVKTLGVMSGVYTILIIYFISTIINVIFFLKINAITGDKEN